MGIEFTITKDLATISATVSELSAVNTIICEEIGSADFHQEYTSLLWDILNTYRVVNRIVQPMVDIQSFAEFNHSFMACHQEYSGGYQAALSEPRVNAEFTFEKYLQFRKRKETKTSYPLLKRSFSRLHDFIDKWIDNDIWLAMTIDTLLKGINRFLSEVAELNSKDQESAYALFSSVMTCMPPYLEIIASRTEAIAAQLRYDEVPLASGAPGG